MPERGTGEIKEMKIIIDNDDKVIIGVPIVHDITLDELKQRMKHLEKFIKDFNAGFSVSSSLHTSCKSKVVHTQKTELESKKSKHMRKLTKQDVENIKKEFKIRSKRASTEKGFKKKKIRKIKKDLAKEYGVTVPAISYYTNGELK